MKALGILIGCFGLGALPLFASSGNTSEMHDDSTYTKHKKKVVSVYDTSRVFRENWNEHITFCYPESKLKSDQKIHFTDTIRGYAFPVEKRTTSGFGRRHSGHHKGIDIPLRVGEPIVAAFDGKVRYAQFNRGGFGNLVIIRHLNGLETYYAHLSKIKVKSNQVVKAGEIIGLGGSTGRSYSPHLHFEIRYQDAPFDPEHIFDLENYCLKKESIWLSELIRKVPTTPSLSPKDLANGEIYTISSGDTLSKIASKTGKTIEELCAMNNIDRNAILQIGQKIRVN